MVIIDLQNLSSVLAKKGFKRCSGLNGKKCMRPRRSKGYLCQECHRVYMKEFMAKKRGKPSLKTLGGGGGERFVDDYDMNQENNI